jgi:hypothetical protein
MVFGGEEEICCRRFCSIDGNTDCVLLVYETGI